jgi:hypothetical protein
MCDGEIETYADNTGGKKEGLGREGVEEMQDVDQIWKVIRSFLFRFNRRE